jgi:hypothetical protein
MTVENVHTTTVGACLVYYKVTSFALYKQRKYVLNDYNDKHTTDLHRYYFILNYSPNI